MSAFEDFIQVELPRRPWVVDDPAQESVPVRRGAGPRQLDFVEMTDGQVLGKLAGVVQGITIPGLGGDIVKGYVHQQIVPMEGWFITHNLDSEDFVLFVFDDSGDQVIPHNTYAMDADTVVVEVNAQMSGKAVIIFAS